MTDNNYPLALPLGTVLAGQYVIERVLGQGGFGITYQAKDHKTGQSVAVKEFFPDTMAARTTQTTVSAFTGERGESFAYGKGCFLKEAETLAQFIGNESIVRVFSYFEENGTAYFVMEFIEGTSFDEYIKERGGKISYEEAEKIMLPVIDALAAVHAKGIVHRDVTPDNIYITKEGKVKLLDFGAARYSLGDKSRSLDVVLKHGFAPKEQYTRHGKQGPFTDVYTVGASLYFAVTGRRPPDSIDRIEEDELVPPSSLGVKIAPEKEDAILTAMSVQPQGRYQSMGAFRQALMGVPAVGQSAPMAGRQGMSASMPPQGGHGQSMQGTQGGFAQAAAPANAAGSSMPMQGQGQQGMALQPASHAAEPKKKKWLLPAGIGAGVVLAVIVIILVIPSGKSEKKSASYVLNDDSADMLDIFETENTANMPGLIAGNDDSSDNGGQGSGIMNPGAFSNEAADREAPIVSVGNLTGNIANGAYFITNNDGIACWYPGAGLVWSGSDGASVYDSTDGVIQSISVVDGMIYYIDADNRACQVGTDGTGIAYMSEAYGYEILKLWAVSDGFYFVTTDYRLCYSETGELPSGSVEIYDGPVFYDNSIYFVPTYDPQGLYRIGKKSYIDGNGGEELVCRINAGDIVMENESGMTEIKGNGSLCPYVAADGYIYVLYSEAVEGTTAWEAILQIDLSTGALCDTMINPAIEGGHITSVNEADGYLYFANYNELTQEASVERTLTSCFQAGTGTIDTVWEGDSRYIASVSVLPTESMVAFYRVDAENCRQIVVMEADGSGEPTIFSEGD